MTLLPVLERELRAESRSTFTYLLRVVGGVSLLGAGVLVFLNAGQAQPEGRELFAVLHLTLFCAIWMVVPLMTADCISREKREGTLGLLFLTPLRAYEVVLAKGLAHGLRATALCLAAVPVLVVPFVLGGVGWMEALVALLVDGSAFCLALGAGLLASAWNQSMTWAMGWAEGLALGLALTLFILLGVLPLTMVLVFVPNAQPVGSPGWGVGNAVVEVAAAVFADPDRVIQWLSQNSPTAGPWAMFAVVTTLVLFSLAGLMGMLGLAAVGVKRQAHERPRSMARERLEKELCAPVFGVRLFRRWMRRLLERNPMGWLERRTWQSRLVTWSWLAVLTLLYTMALMQNSFRIHDFDELQRLLALLLAGNVALTAAGSLRRERESGLMELMLVSPLQVGQIITGRLRGLWGQFLPAAALLLGLWFWMILNLDGLPDGYAPPALELARVGFVAVTLLTLPVVGLYFSLRCRLLVVALFSTVVVGLVLPVAAAELAWLALANETGSWPLGGAFVQGLGLAAAAGALGLALRPWHGLRAVSFALAATLAITALACWAGLRSPDRAGFFKQHLPAATLCVLAQTALAAVCARLLYRRLEQRRFALPA